MVNGNARKRNAPAHLREECWYLVSYEDDDTLRVLGKDEIQPIFPDEDGSGDDAEYNVGDVVIAIWLPNGQFYDAKVLQSGNDRNELMRERMRLEKARKSETTQGPDKIQETGMNGRRQQPEQDERSGQKGKKKTTKQTNNVSEKDGKAKEREEKRKKKEEEQQQQKAILEARKAQAASRWATTPSNSEQELDFTPEPIRRQNTSPILQSPMPQARANIRVNDTGNCSGLSSCSTPVWQQNTSLIVQPPMPRAQTNVRSIRENDTGNHSIINKQPLKVAATPKPKNTGEPRRGLHFQCAVADSSDEDQESDEEEERASLPKAIGDCCKERQHEIEALRKRLNKTHRRLNIALKAKTSEEIIQLRPAAGVLDEKLAAEYKMVEVMEGSGVYWYSHQRAYCSAFKCWSGYINAAIDIFFKKETLAASCAKGNEKKSKTGSAHPPLTPLIIQTLIGKTCTRFGKEGPTPSQVTQKINMKCVEARRPQRMRVLKPQQNN